MKNKDIHTLLAVIVLILIGAIWQIVELILEHRPITNYPPKNGTVLILGDSLTAGVGASSSAHGFVSILEERVHVPIINKGVIGDTSADGLQRLERDVLALKPGIVMVLLGGNDTLRKIPTQETFTNLRNIITRTQSQGAIVILIGVRGGILNDKYGDDFDALAKETGSLYVPDVLDGIITDQSLMSDEVHPNDRGYEKIADKVAPTLLSVTVAIPLSTSNQ